MVRLTDRPAMTIAVDLGRKATKQTNKQTNCSSMQSVKAVLETYRTSPELNVVGSGQSRHLLIRHI